MRFRVENGLPLAALTLLAACGGGSARPLDVAQFPATGPAADYPMVLGPAFAVDGVTYTPSDTMNYDAVGYAGMGTEGGAGVSAAHRTLPLPSYVEVTALESGKTILVRVERRGPMTGSQLIELSPGATAQLGVPNTGKVAIRVRRVNPTEQDRAALRSGVAAPARMDTPKSLLAVLQRKLDTQEGIVRPVPAPEPEPTVASALPPKAEVKPNPVPKPVPKPAPAPTRPATSAAAPVPVQAPAKPPAPTARGRIFVQVGAFASKANADGAAKKIGGSSGQAGKLWRVRMGPFASESEAKAALAKAKSAGYSDARIQRAD